MKWLLIVPEIYFLCMAAVFLGLAMLKSTNGKRLHRIALFLAMLGVLVSLASVRSEGALFSQAYRVDFFSQLFKAMLALGYFLVVCLCSELRGIPQRRHPEFFLLLTTCTLGMMVLVSGVELLTIYIALELTSYSLYVLVPMRSGEGSHVEASIKYFLAGVSTSAVMLFGLASLFGATHTTYVAQLADVLPGLLHQPMAFIGLLLTLCGFFFKLALFPFHVWAPSVYQGAANQVTAYIATSTKVTAMAMLTRIVAMGGGLELGRVLILLAIVSMTLGNLVAIVQEDMKRLLAYSAIAHAGYVLVGILSMSQSGYAGAVFYAMAYLIMTFTCFLVMVKVAGDGSDLKIAQLAGLHRRSPLLAMALMVGVFSLGGIPPTIGFTGKFLIFSAAMQKGYFFLVLIGMVNVAISLYYYALIVKAAFLLEPDEELGAIRLSFSTRLLTCSTVILMVAGGFFPGHLYKLALAAARMLL